MANPSAPVSAPDYDWRDDDSIVVHEQPVTAIYLNTYGQVVIRQRAEVFEDDPFVVISMNNLPAVIAALTQELHNTD